MVVRRRKKSRKLRAEQTHGRGFKKRARGKGSKGGHGMRGGSAKRGQSRKFISGGVKRVGKGSYGLGTVTAHKKMKAINIRTLDYLLDKWVANGLAEVKNGVYVVDLKKAGYDKLLSTGRLTKKADITCVSCTERARKAVEASGGKVVVLNKNYAKT